MDKWKNKVNLILFLTQKLFQEDLKYCIQDVWTTLILEIDKPGQLQSLYGKQQHEHSAKYLLLRSM